MLEVNSNPGLEISSPLISKLVPRMIDDCLRLTIDKVFKTVYTFSNESTDKGDSNKYYSPFSVDGYSNNENLWYVLFI